MSCRRRWILFDHVSVLYCVTFILRRSVFDVSHFLFFRKCAYATVHFRYCLRKRMRLGYRLHVSSGDLRDNHLLRCLTFGGNSEKDGDKGRFHSACRVCCHRAFPFSLSLGSPQSLRHTGDGRIQTTLSLIVVIIILNIIVIIIVVVVVCH